MRIKVGLCVMLAGIVFTSAAACGVTTYMSYAFTMENGDQVTVRLDTTDGHKISQGNGRVYILLEEETVLQCIFLDTELCTAYDEEIRANPDVTILAERSQDGNKYLFYTVEGAAGTEHDFLVKISDTDTGMLIGSLSGEETALRAFKHLHLSKAD